METVDLSDLAFLSVTVYQSGPECQSVTVSHLETVYLSDLAYLSVTV